MMVLPGLWARAWHLLTRPARTWDALAAHRPSAMSVLGQYVLPLAAVAALGCVVGLAGVGLDTAGFGYKLSWGVAFRQVGLGLAVVLGGLVWTALAAHRSAPLFEARGDFSAAFSAVAHAGTPVYLAGALMVWPPLGRVAPLALLGCLPLLHLGLRRLMQPAPRRAVPYTVSVVIAGLVYWFLLTLVPGCGPKESRSFDVVQVPLVALLPEDGAPADSRSSSTRSGTETIDGERGSGGSAVTKAGRGGPVAMDLDDAGGLAAVVGGPGLSAGGNPLTRTVLQDLLPAAPEGYRRDIVDSHAFTGPRDTAPGAALHGAFTDASYTPLDKAAGGRRRVTITDLTPEVGTTVVDGLLGEIIDTGGARELEDGRGERRVEEEDGERFVVTEFRDDTDARRRFARVEVYLGRRYKVVGEAEGLALEELRSWLSQVDFSGLEARARQGRPIE